MEETVKEWITHKDKLAQVKSDELESRNKICDHILQGKLKGAKKGVIGIYTLTATAKLGQKIDEDELKVIWPDLSPIEKKCIKFDPRIIAKEYKDIPADSIINQAIETKPGTPTLELKSVKE